MCGRFTLAEPNLISERFNTSNSINNFDPSWNIAPSQMVPTITRNSPNKIVMMKWGLLFNKSSKTGVINIRSETTLEKPYFQHLLTNNRCLIVADSFYEWGDVNLEGKSEKYPFNFFLDKRRLFGFAGIYNDIKDAEDKIHFSCSILTTKPNKIVARAHNRMPVIIKEKDEEFWLDPKNTNFEKLFKLLAPFPEKEMKVNVVSKRVNSPANDDMQLIDPVKQILQ